MLGPMFFRPRPLKAVTIHIWNYGNLSTTGMSGWGVVDGRPVLWTEQASNYSNERWSILFPGVYLVEVVGGGGGGGGGDDFYGRMGEGGSAGVLNTGLRTFTVAPVTVGILRGGLGGAAPNLAGGGGGNLTMPGGREGSVTGGGGAGGRSSFALAPMGADASQNASSPGPAFQYVSGNNGGRGGRGGWSGRWTGEAGRPGQIVLTLVG